MRFGLAVGVYAGAVGAACYAFERVTAAHHGQFIEELHREPGVQAPRSREPGV